MNQSQTAPQDTGELPDVADQFGTVDQAEQPQEFELLNLNKLPSGLFITLVGKDSEAYRALSRKMQNKRFVELRKTRTLTMTAEGNEAETLTLLAAVVRSWRSRVFQRDANGKLQPTETFRPVCRLKQEMLECNAANVRRVLKEAPEIRDQIEDLLDERANFLQGSQQTSSSSPE